MTKHSPTTRKKGKVDITKTEDRFIASVPWGCSRMVLVHRRLHGWREYIRFRTWHCHCVKKVWYPSRRFFIIPIGNARALARAILWAVRDKQQTKPDWLIDREFMEDEKIRALEKSGASPETIEEAKNLLSRDRRDRI